jgi:hypothetical protein
MSLKLGGAPKASCPVAAKCLNQAENSFPRPEDAEASCAILM